MAGKGDTPRAVNGSTYRRNFEMIFPNKTKRPTNAGLADDLPKVEQERNAAREAFAIATSNCVDAHQRLREIERGAREAVQQ
jgi:hypothetical protein